MKRLLVLLLILGPLAVMAQKDVKPSVQKAEKALKERKLDEAKAIIDATVESQEFMVNKKGEPSKQAAKAWFLKGVIYAAIDTTKIEKWKALDADPFPKAKEAFDKSAEIDKGESKGFILNELGLPMPNEDIKRAIAQQYINKSISAYQDEKDPKKALKYAEETLYFIPGDTSILLYAGAYFAPPAEENEKALSLMKQYVEHGGKSPDAYIMMFGIYRDKMKDMDAALKVAQDAMKRFPNNTEFPKYELDVYIKTNRLPEAKIAMEKQALADPSDKESRYYLGVISYELKQYGESRKWYDEALKIDPKYFDAHLAVAELVYLDAKQVKQQMNQLGITKEDQKKRLELDKVYVDKLKLALPYFENCEKMSPDEAKVLDNLLAIYTDLGVDAQIARIEKKMKALGLLD